MYVGESSVMAPAYSVSLRPESDSNTENVFDPRHSRVNDIWFVDEVLTDCGGSPRLLPPLPVPFAGMCATHISGQTPEIKQTGIVWPDTIYISAGWRVSG